MKILLRRFYFVMPLGILMGIVLCAQAANKKQCKGLIKAAPYTWAMNYMVECRKFKSVVIQKEYCSNYYVKWPDKQIHVQCKSIHLGVNRDPNKDYACVAYMKDSCIPP